jgi:hypothetical protein
MLPATTGIITTGNPTEKVIAILPIPTLPIDRRGKLLSDRDIKFDGTECLEMILLY